jgi:hypothetical protein
VTTEAQDMSTPEARAAYFEQCWKLAAEAGNEARSALEAAHADRERVTCKRCGMTWVPVHDTETMREVDCPGCLEADRANRAEAERDAAVRRAEDLQAALAVERVNAGNERANLYRRAETAERDAATLRGALGDALALAESGYVGVYALLRKHSRPECPCHVCIGRRAFEAEYPAKRDRLRALASEGPAAPCQHVLVAEEQKCRHGFFFGSTCEKCVAECAGCRTMFAATEAQGETPAAGTCLDCKGPVFHRPGKPGEFDHACAQGETDAAPEARDPKRWHLCHHDILVKDCRACQEAGCCGAAPAPADPRKD